MMKVVMVGVAFALWAAVPRADTAIAFVDVAVEAGLQLLNVSGGPAKDYIVESVGNGAAFFDFDNDGHLDVLIVNGSTRERLAAGGDPMVALFRNDGGGRFVDVTARSGLAARRGWGMGVCIADYDNDGFQDVYVTAFGGNVLWRNNGDGTFADVTRRAGIGHTGWGTGCAFGDYDRDGHVDLYVANYVLFDDRTIPARGATPNCRFMEVDVFCGPRNLMGEPDVLYRNNGDGTFADVTASAGVTGPAYYGFGVLFADLNDDGWPDIYVANDSVPNLLFINQRDGTFSDDGLVAGVALSGDGRPQAGMGVGAGDYTGNGLLDLVVTNFSHDHTTLYENDSPGLFTDSSYAAGIAATAGPYLGWGVGFLDVDNDGRLDVFVANGHIYPQVDRHALGTTYRQRNQLFHNQGNGRFQPVAQEAAGGGLRVEQSSRGAAFGDFDNDGDLDVLVINIDDRPTLLRNDSAGGNHWFAVRLVGERSNRDGIGARVRVTANGQTQTTEVRSGGSYLSHHDMRAHVGLGRATQVDRLEIRWPSGHVDTATGLTAGRFYVAHEGKGVRLDER
jgi:enediyne biosynthesis protein E4